MADVTPDLYSGRVGHDVSEGFCSCGGHHTAEDGIRVGTKTVLTQRGRVAYSPDYKTLTEAAMDEGRKIAESVIAANKISAELARLEREVIEAAKEDLASETRKEGDHGIDRLIAARRRYRAAVIALLEFESLHGNQK